ncbi:MAG: transporter associated domain-containing protein, partial [Pseudomonadota bacterium]
GPKLKIWHAEKIDLEKISAKPWFIPDTTSLYDQLQSFRERREHFALVVDEYGSFMGIITLEDILEEIVGTIHDEHDKIAKGIWEQENGSFVVDGAKSLRELNRELDWNLPEDGVSTVAGLILKETRMIPFAKQVFNFHGMRFEILERKRNRLERIRVIPLSEPSSPTFKKSDSAPSKSKL